MLHLERYHNQMAQQFKNGKIFFLEKGIITLHSGEKLLQSPFTHFTGS